MNPTSMKTFALGDLFTETELEEAHKIYLEGGGEHTLNYALTKFVEPRMEHINQVTGQENDARYIAYMLEAVFSGAIK